MSLQIDSRVFEVKDQNSMKQLMSFLSLDIQLEGQRYVFKDDQQFTKFEKFRSSFDTIKGIFPNFEMKIKPKLGSNNQNPNPSFKKEKDETYQQNLSTQFNSDQSLTNNKGDQSYQKGCETPTDQGQVQLEQKQIQQKIQQVNPKEAVKQNVDNESSIMSEVENSQDYSMHVFSERVSQIIDQSMNIFDDKIKIKLNDKTFTIQLKNTQILQIIEQLYLEKWIQLIKQLHLTKQSMNCYKLQQNTDQFYINQEIQNFIDSIQSVEIQFCFYSCYTMKEQQSMMNRYLSQHQVQIAQIGDEFYLVSREQSQKFLQEIAQQIYENYRGYMFYFASSKPYPNYIQNNPFLEKSRYLFYKKYLSQDVQQYSFNQYFNENFFFIEMNFSKIQERRELIEKYTKEYIGGFIKNLFLIKFSISTTQDIHLKVEKAFQDGIEHLKFKILFYKNNEDLILFGINEDILKLLLYLQGEEFKYQFKKFDVEVDKENFLFKLKGAQQKIDVNSIIDLLQEFGYQQPDNKKLQFSTSLDRNQSFQNLVSILKYFCINREQNNNRMALQILHQKFRNAIDKKELEKEMRLLKQINTNNIEQFQLQQLQQQQQQQQKVISLNIRAELQQFPISQTIILNPVFLDEIIQENLYQEFLDQLVSNNQKIQFFKISQGNYQLQCINDQVVTQFKQYFDKFQNVKLELDKSSISCFELSHYLKKELKKRCIYWKVMESESLYLITRNNESLKYAQDFKYYKGKIISMLSLKETNLNEKVEYHSLVLARTNYFKYKIQDFLKQNLTQIKEIEFREEQEISSFCIIHTNIGNQGQQIDKCIEQIQCLIGSKTFLELKTKPEFGKKILEKIIDISDLYVSQKQEYQDYYITMLGSKKNFQKIDQLFQKLQLPNEQLVNLQISFYIEQFIPYKNLVQKTSNRDKFKKFLESKGFFVDDTNIKWTIETKQQLSKSNLIFIYLVMIFTNLTEWMNQDYMQNIRNNYLLNLEMMEESDIQINVSQNNVIEIENSLLSFLEKDNNSNKKVDNRNLQILQQSGYIDNQVFQENFILPQELSRRSISEISDCDSHINQSSMENQGYKLLAEFPKGAQQKELPADSQLAQTLRANYSNQNILAFEPYVDQNYKEYFYKLASDYVDLYVVQKPDKVYKGKFSKSMLYLMKPKNAIEKLIENPQSILIVFKTNKLCKFTNYNDKEKIILTEDNQVLPYLFLQKK